MSLPALYPQKSLHPEEVGTILRGGRVLRQERSWEESPLLFLLNMFLLPVGTDPGDWGHNSEPQQNPTGVQLLEGCERLWGLETASLKLYKQQESETPVSIVWVT